MASPKGIILYQSMGRGNRGRIAWQGYKKSEPILGRIPCYGMAQDAFSGYEGLPRLRSGFRLRA